MSVAGRVNVLAVRARPGGDWREMVLASARTVMLHFPAEAAHYRIFELFTSP